MKQRVGFVSSLFLASMPVLLVAVELAAKAAEPKWPGQSLSTWATLGRVSRVTSTIAGWSMFPAIIASAFCIQSLTLTERKRRSILAIGFTLAAVLLMAVFQAVQEIYIPASERDPTRYAERMLAAPHVIAWLVSHGIIVLGLAVAMFGVAFILFGASTKPEQSCSQLNRLMAITGAICVLVGASFPLGPFVAGPLYMIAGIGFVASYAALSFVFLRLSHGQ